MAVAAGAEIGRSLRGKRAVWILQRSTCSGRQGRQGRPGARSTKRSRFKTAPAWAADILELACSRLTAVPGEVSLVAELALDPCRWPEAHAAFSAVRRLSLKKEVLLPTRTEYRLVLPIAENAAKVVYIASSRPAPFDYDCGAKLVSSLRALVDAVNLPDFERRAWSLFMAWLVCELCSAESPAAPAPGDR
jgi:hypothetical protein